MEKFRASKLEIRDVNKAEERQFLNDNHYQGYVPSKWCKGLYIGDKLYCLMSFGLSRYNSRYDWELLRLCTRKDCQVYGGASRLLKAFTSENVGSIISYCNESKFTGKVYEALGFTKLGICSSYHYEKDGKSYHRSSFQKWRCLEKWPQYVGKDITEREIMQEQGYTRVEEKQATWSIGDRWYIYEIENQGLHYIGQHIYRDNTNDDYTGSGTIIQRVNQKHPDTINKIILLDNITDPKLADRYEKCAIYYNKLIYGNKNVNIQSGGHQTHRTITYDDIREKLSESKKGDKNPAKREDVRRRISETLKSRKQAISEETRRKLSEAGKRSKGRKGRKHTEAEKLHLSNLFKGRKLSEDQRTNVSNGGKKYWTLLVTTADYTDFNVDDTLNLYPDCKVSNHYYIRDYVRNRGYIPLKDGTKIPVLSWKCNR